MGIVSVFCDKPGQIGMNPRRVKVVTTADLATITAAGYFNAVTLQGQSLYPTDFVDVVYSYNAQTNSGTDAVLTLAFNNGVITASQWVDTGNVLLPVTSGNLASFNGTSGQIQDSSLAASNVVKLNAANTLTGSGSISLVKGTATEASNAVTLSKQAGVITTSDLTTAGGASYAITWTNTFISASSVILLSNMGGTNTTEDFMMSVVPGSGTATLTIYNNTAATAFDGNIIIGFAVF
jgi:hypothetical protein